MFTESGRDYTSTSPHPAALVAALTGEADPKVEGLQAFHNWGFTGNN